MRSDYLIYLTVAMQGVKLEISEETVRKLASEWSDTQAAKLLGIATSSFFVLRKRHGIQSFTKSTGCRRSLQGGQLLHPGQGTAHPWHRDLRVDCFQNIDSPDKAYYLGLLAADGHTSLKPNAKFTSIELQFPDADVLNGLAKLLNYRGSCERVTRKGKRPSGRLLIHSRLLTESLVSQGITLNTEQHFLPSTIPRELRGHCLRGLLDGDGHISAKKKSLYLCSCSQAIIFTVSSWVAEGFSVEPVIHSRVLPSGKSFFTMTFGGKPRKILQWTYGAGAPCITRKKLEADTWIEMVK